MKKKPDQLLEHPKTAIVVLHGQHYTITITEVIPGPKLLPDQTIDMILRAQPHAHWGSPSWMHAFARDIENMSIHLNADCR